MTVAVGLKRHDICDVSDLFCGGSTTNRRVRRRLKPQLTPARLDVCRWCVASSSNCTETVAIAKVQCTELRFANARGVREHSVKDRLQLARRTGDDLQHLRCRRLLLE